MKLLLIIAAAVLIGLLPDLPRKRRKTRKTAENKKAPPYTLYDVEKAKRDRQQAAKKAQAQRDIETAKATINDLDLLMDAAQRRYYGASKDKDTEKALRQIITLRKQIAVAESKIKKAEYILEYGG